MLTLKLFKENYINDAYLNWFKDKGFTEYLEVSNITKEQAIEHYRQCNTDGSFFYAIFLQEEHVGNIKLNADNDLSTIIFPPYQGRGYSTQAIKIILAATNGYEITAGIRSGNIGSLKAYQKCGFHIDSTVQGVIHLSRYKRIDRCG